MSGRLSNVLGALLASGRAAIEVRVEAARGSTPREAGTAMLVTAGDIAGTVGGGRLEWQAIARAREMLVRGETVARLDVPLGPAVGQCCGGHVTLALGTADRATLERLREQERAAAVDYPQVLLFGAGHVGRAIAAALAPLPLRVRWIDGRDNAFPSEIPPGIEVVRSPSAVAEVEAADGDAAFLVLTHSHAIDFELCAAVLAREFAYLGLIGSATKRAKFERGLRELGFGPAAIGRLVCPIGSRGVRDKRPPVIAALVAAELITMFAASRAGALPDLARAG
jgi:xanthine dehydrogenase accessory protein XdhC